MPDGNKSNRTDLAVHCILYDIDQRRQEMNLHQNSMMTIITAYLTALLIVIGIVYKDIDTMLLLIPAFIASGMAFICYRQRIFFSLAAYTCWREKDVNLILNMHEEEINLFSLIPLKWEEIIHKFDSSIRVRLIDTVLMLITFFPIIIIYLKSLVYIYKYLPENSIYIIIFNSFSWTIPNKYSIIFTIYTIFFIILIIIFRYMGSRNFYEYTKKFFQSQ